MNKPQGYAHATRESCFYLIALCLPFYQSLLIAGMSGIISVLLLTALLVLFAAHSSEISRTVAALLESRPLPWAASTLSPIQFRIAALPLVVASGPSLAPSFQRPPPSFS
jgi:hypothetical protein